MQTTALPIPNHTALAQSAALCAQIRAEIKRERGWISFAHYMEMALYTPGLGYYSGMTTKFGAAGDFVTAPEISPLFGHTLARACLPWLATYGHTLIEFGAGTGQLAVQLLTAFHELGRPLERYIIVELSATLRAQQQNTLADWPCVTWVDTLPSAICGVILANEVLDALPVQIFVNRTHGINERGVSLNENGEFIWAERMADRTLSEAVAEIQTALATAWPIGYISEICPVAEAFIHSLSHILDEGVICLIDYGFPQHEYYHVQRTHGTLMCHYRQQAHNEPFLWPGLQDLTAHVDFTRIALAGNAAGLDLIGYTNQANFLINSGLTELLAQIPIEDTQRYARHSAQVQKLLSEAEMGELFKVIAFVKDTDKARRAQWTESIFSGFQHGERSHRL